MILYAESSAVLAWLLGQRRGEEVRGLLRDAELVVASGLTLLECQRVLTRAARTGLMLETQAADLRARLAHAALHWVLLALDADVLARSGRPFPGEPIRTLDAVHLATALAARAAVPQVTLLSLDQRVRRSGAELGFELVPARA